MRTIQEDLTKEFIAMWQRYVDAGFGGMFFEWCYKSRESGHPVPPYNSYGNGNAMRISPVGWVADTEEHLKPIIKKKNY